VDSERPQGFGAAAGVPIDQKGALRPQATGASKEAATLASLRREVGEAWGTMISTCPRGSRLA
jgi:hypothetical protein